eukprot:5007738-Pyramimonas_sp.AAC.1
MSLPYLGGDWVRGETSSWNRRWVAARSTMGPRWRSGTLLGGAGNRAPHNRGSVGGWGSMHPPT